MNNYRFGNFICELREKKGLSQSQLGEKLGVTNKAVSRWENGSAYPSTELMLPLAKELGITIEDLYKAISDDKAPKTKLRTILDFLACHSKIVTIVCLSLALIPYILTLCFASAEEIRSVGLAIPVILVIAYAGFYFTMALSRRSPFASAKYLDVYTFIALIFFSLAYLSILRFYILDFPTASPAVSALPMILMAILHSLKRRYK